MRIRSVIVVAVLLAAALATASVAGAFAYDDWASSGAAMASGDAGVRPALACDGSEDPCVEVGLAGSVELISPWGTALPPAVTGTLPATPTVNAVACPARSRCVAVTAEGAALVFDPRRPQAAAKLTLGMHAVDVVACPSSRVCAAFDNVGHAIAFDPRAMTTRARVGTDPGALPADVDCPAIHVCVMVDTAGRAVTFDPATGSHHRRTLDAGAQFTAIECPADCVAVTAGRDGHVVTFDPTLRSRSIHRQVVPGRPLTSIGCPFAHICLAGTTGGRVAVADSLRYRVTLVTIPAATTILAVGSGGVRQAVVLDANGSAFVSAPAPSD